MLSTPKFYIYRYEYQFAKESIAKYITKSYGLEQLSHSVSDKFCIRSYLYSGNVAYGTSCTNQDRTGENCLHAD